MTHFGDLRAQNPTGIKLLRKQLKLCFHDMQMYDVIIALFCISGDVNVENFSSLTFKSRRQICSVLGPKQCISTRSNP
jgi:hypothetical protein